jgi:hypothetical protein
MSEESGSTVVVLYRTESSAMLLTVLASASVDAGVLHAHGPALHGERGTEVAETVAAVARSREAEAIVWDGDAPTDANGVRGLVRDTGAGLLVVEWQPRMVDGHLDLARQVLDNPPCDVLMVRPGGLTSVEGITVAIGEGRNVPVAVRLTRRWADAFDVPATALRGVADDSEVAGAEALCAQVAPGLPTRIPVGRDLVNLLVTEAERSGFVALGATEGFPLDRVGVRTVGTRLAHRADATIVVARANDT